jgi:hypothetical protein
MSTKGGLTKRHNVTRDMLHKLAMDARKVILNDGTNRRPADVFIQTYSMIQALAVDVAVVDGGCYGKKLIYWFRRTAKG